jgi:shikimate kinase
VDQVSIVLTGMMGAGKSSVGRCLQRRTGLALLDIDELVVLNLGMSILEIFAKHGEEKFRDAETEALRHVRTGERRIIVTGGGIVLRKENVEILRSLGPIAWLDGDEATLFSRARRKRYRPLLQTKNPRMTFSQILCDRRPFYESIADFRVDTSILTIEEVAVAILRKLRGMKFRPERSARAQA